MHSTRPPEIGCMVLANMPLHQVHASAAFVVLSLSLCYLLVPKPEVTGCCRLVQHVHRIVQPQEHHTHHTSVEVFSDNCVARLYNSGKSRPNTAGLGIHPSVGRKPRALASRVEKTSKHAPRSRTNKRRASTAPTRNGQKHTVDGDLHRTATTSPTRDY